MLNENEEKIILNGFREVLKHFTNNQLYRCPCCGKIIEWDDANYNPEDATYTCPKCGETFNEFTLQAISLYELIEEMFIAFKEKNDETDFE